MSYRHITKEEIKAKWPNDEDLQYGFDGTDRYGRTYYGKGIRVSVGPSPVTGYLFTAGFNNPRISSTGGKNHTPLDYFSFRDGPVDGGEITNRFALRNVAEPGDIPLYPFVSGDHPPLHSYD